jgi:urea transport system substrate-binding protein
MSPRMEGAIVSSSPERGTAKLHAIVCIVLLVGLVALGFIAQGNVKREPIRVGLLHSLTGTMSISERAVVDATLLAISQLNRRGGVLGRQIEPVIVDGESNWSVFAQGAERLITQDKVQVVFGCWTSASRRTVKPVFERHDHLLIYPVQYEGLEQSPNIVYTGAAPNQQITPAVKWSLDNLGKRVFLVGSDYVFPRTANAIIRTQVEALGGAVVGERYLTLGTKTIDETLAAIVQARPDVIFNTINGDTNVAFFQGLKRAGLSAKRTPTVSFSMAETEMAAMGAAETVGHYAVWNYFQSVGTAENRIFVEAFRERYGQQRVLNDPMEAAYVGVMLWAQGVERARRTEPRSVRESMRGLSFAAPGGAVYVDPETQHLWKPVRVGKIRADQQFDIVWQSDRPVRPIPYPTTRTVADWTEFLAAMQQQWNGEWAAP